MSKERLEEIKKELELDWSDISYVVNQNDVKWLVNRVRKLEQQIKRYREALEAIYELAEYDEYDNTLEQIVSEVEKALEGEE